MRKFLNKVIKYLFFLFFYLTNCLFLLQLSLSTYYDGVHKYLLFYLASIIIFSFGLPALIGFLLWENHKLYQLLMQKNK